jgi:hypothetical protein
VLGVLLCVVCFAQTAAIDDLTSHQWHSEATVDNFSLATFDKIGLGKVQVSIDSLKNDCSIWTFKNGKLLIQKYTRERGLETNGIVCSYFFKNGELNIIHDFQDSAYWRYKIGVVSSGSFISLLRQNLSVVQNKHIEQSTPFENILISLKTDSTKIFRDAFSKRIIAGDTSLEKWEGRLSEAKEKLGQRFGDYNLADFTYSFNTGESELVVYWKSEEVIKMNVVKEDNDWKLDEK